MRPSETVGEFSSSSEADADAAVAAARRVRRLGRAAAGAPRRVSRPRRPRRSRRAPREVARDMATEMGKPLREARGETGAGRADAALRGERGVPAGRRALRAGRSSAQVSTQRRAVEHRRADHAVELPARDPDLEARAGARPREHGSAQARVRGAAAPGCTSRRAFANADLPAGVLNVSSAAAPRSGQRSCATRASARSRSRARCDGQTVRDEATRLNKRVQLELGGHNPLVVMADADLGRAVEAAYAARSGRPDRGARRRGGSTSRTRCTRRSATGCSRGSTAAAVGDPLDPDDGGRPDREPGAVDDVIGAIDRGRREGARSSRRRASRRRRLPRRADGVRGRRRRAILSCEEVFGRDDAVRFARSTGDGTANAVESGCRRRSSRRASRRRALPARRRPACCTSTRRRPAPTCTCRSAGSRERVRPARAGPGSDGDLHRTVTVYVDRS